MTWDEFIYTVITLVVVAFVAWLLFTAAPGHDPLIVFQHTRLAS